ncbi:MAG: radical SAM/Cys-rich domain protein [Nitrospirae bacterium]|nr:MAG: radical SAM/Cys-rich domain protein [Nitrospirota bacterium]
MAIQSLFCEKSAIARKQTDLIQINLGNKCNQTCSHCHIGASPAGENNMEAYAAERILDKLIGLDIRNIEFTGGAPELNPNLTLFIRELSACGKDITVRTNLTVLDTSEYSFFIELYRENNVKIIASLPSVYKKFTDIQRGEGVFDKSIKVLRTLNEIGYGTAGLLLDLVHNPAGASFPSEQASLEKEYQMMLKESYGIHFNSLITIANSPVNRFKDYLMREGIFGCYMNMLERNHNSGTIENLMCRHLLSVDYQGHLHDCDFNLALGIRIKDFEDIKFWDVDIGNFKPEITFGRHCYACTANQGSSCHGILIKDSAETKNIKCCGGSGYDSRSEANRISCF